MSKDEKVNIILRKTAQLYNKGTILEKLLSEKKLIIKFGADPSRPDLHIGHTVVLRALKSLQELGHEIVFVIGDFTAMIGDPFGKSKTRPALTFEETRKSGETYFKQVTKILDKEKTRIAYNSEWLGKKTFEDVIQLTGKYTLARLLERDDFKKRFNENVSIGMHEMLYPLMQGYDSVAIQADIEVGGTDQTFNLLVGRELQRDYKQPAQDVMTFPLLIGLDGKEKMSKSLDNYIGIDESPEIMYEKAMKVPDELLLDYFKLTTDVELEKAEQWIDHNIVKAHIQYARELVKMYHGEASFKNAENRYKSIASGKIPQKINEFKLETSIIEKGIRLTELLWRSGLAASKSEARRLIEQNGISLNNKKEKNVDRIIEVTDVQDHPFVIKKGKSHFVKVILSPKI